jgi:hypothetical protein
MKCKQFIGKKLFKRRTDLTLIGLGEVKVYLTDFDLKLQEKL